MGIKTTYTVLWSRSGFQNSPLFSVEKRTGFSDNYTYSIVDVKSVSMSKDEMIIALQEMIDKLESEDKMIKDSDYWLRVGISP